MYLLDCRRRFISGGDVSYFPTFFPKGVGRRNPTLPPPVRRAMRVRSPTHISTAPVSRPHRARSPRWMGSPFSPPYMEGRAANAIFPRPPIAGGRRGPAYAWSDAAPFSAGMFLADSESRRGRPVPQCGGAFFAHSISAPYSWSRSGFLSFVSSARFTRRRAARARPVVTALSTRRSNPHRMQSGWE